MMLINQADMIIQCGESVFLTSKLLYGKANGTMEVQEVNFYRL